MSNPIASETPHGTVLHEGHYGPVHCHCSECDYLVDSAEAQLQSDPSGKGAEQSALDAALLLHDKVGETTGYSSRNVIPILAAALEQYAASLRQQLSDSQELLDKVREEIKGDANFGATVELLFYGPLRENESELRQAKIRAEEQSFELGRLQGKVSQLEAERDGCRKEIADARHEASCCDDVAMDRTLAEIIGEVQAHRERAIAERDASRKDITKLVAEVDGARQDASDWKRHFDMYARAWGRELGPRRHKNHLIDELVVGTQELRQRAETLTKERDEVHAANKSLTSQVSVLTKERDELRETWRCFNCDFSTSDRAEALAHFGDADEEQSLCQTWAELDADGRASEYQSQISERNALESRLSAVSEVVRDADEGILFERAMKADIIDHNCYAAGMADGALEVWQKVRTAMTNYEKAQQKEGQ